MKRRALAVEVLGVCSVAALVLPSYGCAGAPRGPSVVAAAGGAAVSPSDACTVWDRENAFARSVQVHDTAAFAEHVLPGAVFVDDGKLLRGRDAIVAAWGPILRGEGMVFRWAPSQVAVTGDPHVALTRGPFWIERTSPGAPHRFITGTFQSVWVKDVDGAWRVAVDGSGGDPVAASEEDIAKLLAALPARCPG